MTVKRNILEKKIVFHWIMLEKKIRILMN